mgnify:CR=1 FL=1
MAEMKNICGKIPVELHEKVRAEIEEKGLKCLDRLIDKCK